ncbi:hypothetical protein [Actinomadura bangladeshensis]|uniref:Uncharacterized protein n=1 Tax=Actinomadura bangladeshensis TaxID=453573 RepID=A0A6L9QED1_9ACTN|nr:hypothetical protein [Actinomadura bangladeshensis]NEA21604.1 hypothetical protein [Actinomadura bangladeshensis]NEA22564.1 hypothetical protein [Actinomadura bangladeshensis]
MASDPYVIAGVNLRQFVLDWLGVLNSGGGEMRGLLEHVDDPRHPSERYRYGAHMMMANIAPRATPAAASDEVLLFFAVMVIYQQAGFPGADPQHFDGFTPHVERAFDHFQSVGETEAARRLAADVIRQMKPGPEPWEAIRQRQSQENPAKSAYYERLMADLYQRDLRAAKLLDPDLDFDAMVLRADLS